MGVDPQSEQAQISYKSETALEPRGTVSFGAEFWRAESLDGHHPACAEVVAVDGLTLKVRKK